MKYPLLSRQKPYLQLLSIVLLTLVSFFVFSLAGMLLLGLILGLPLNELLSGLTHPEATQTYILKILQITQSIGIFVIPSLIFAWLASKHPFKYLGFRNNMGWHGFFLMVIILLSIEPLIAYSGVLNQKLALPEFLSGLENWMQDMEERAMELTETFLHVVTIKGLLLNLLMIAIVPGIGEELFFRGVLQTMFARWFKNKHVAVLISALVFSALHMQFYGFVPRFLLGLLFGYLFVWSGNLWYPILAHTIHNSIPVIGYYLYATEISTGDLDEAGAGKFAWVWAIVGVVILIIFVKRFIQYHKNEKTFSVALDHDDLSDPPGSV